MQESTGRPPGQSPDAASTPPTGPSGNEVHIDSAGRDIRDAVIAGGDVHDVRIGDDITINRPSAALEMYREIKRLLRPHGRLLLAAIVAELGLWAIFYRFHVRYLLAPGPFYLLALLLILALLPWAWPAGLHSRTGGPAEPARRMRLVASGGALLAFVGISGWQVRGVLYPPQFAPEEFGIAIATFGDGSSYAAPPAGYRMADRLNLDMHTAIEQQPGLVDAAEVTSAGSPGGDGRQVVAVRRIGVIGDDPGQAEADGARIGAGLVIWGQIVREGGGLQIHFNMLQTPDLVDDPAFPQQLPTINPVLDNKLTVSREELASFEDEVSGQSLGLTAFSLGLVQFRARKYQAAADQFQVALRYLGPQGNVAGEAAGANSSLALIYYYLGRSYQALTRYDDSQAMLTEAAQRSPDDIAVLLAQVYNYNAMGREEERDVAAARLVRLSYEQPAWAQKQAAYDRGWAYEITGDKEAAASEYLNLAQRYPDFYIAYLSAADILTELARWNEAERMLDGAAAQVNGDTARQIWLELGRAKLLAARGEPEAAAAVYRQAIARDEAHAVASAYFRLAKVYEELGDKAGAAEAYGQLIATSELPGLAHKNYAGYLSSIGDHAGAVTEYKAALRLPLYNVGLAHAQLGLEYLALAKAEPQGVDAAAAAQVLAEFAAAVAEPGPDEAYIRSEYGRVIYELDPSRIGEAIQQMELALRVERTFAVRTRLNLGRLYVAAGKQEKAIGMYRTVVSNCGEIRPDEYAAAMNALIQLGVDAHDCPVEPAG